MKSYVHVYNYTDKWVRKDNNTLISDSFISYGDIIEFNKTGSVMALSITDENLNGGVILYKNKGDAGWEKYNDALLIEKCEYVSSMHLNDGGDRLIVGVVNDNDGVILMYVNDNNNNWVKRGNTLVGNNEGFGSMISVNSYGTKMITGEYH